MVSGLFKVIVPYDVGEPCTNKISPGLALFIAACRNSKSAGAPGVLSTVQVVWANRLPESSIVRTKMCNLFFMIFLFLLSVFVNNHKAFLIFCKYIS